MDIRTKLYLDNLYKHLGIYSADYIIYCIHEHALVGLINRELTIKA